MTWFITNIKKLVRENEELKLQVEGLQEALNALDDRVKDLEEPPEP